MKNLIKKFEDMNEIVKEQKEFLNPDTHEDHLLMSCKCSIFCFDCNKVLSTQGSPIVNKNCGVYCTKCDLIICKKHPGFCVNSLGNAVCFDCRKVILKTDDTSHFCLNFSEKCLLCCRNFNHELYDCKTCGGEACWTCKVVFNEGKNGYYRVNSCGIVDGDKMCKKIVKIAEDHDMSDVYRQSRYFYCKKHKD